MIVLELNAFNVRRINLSLVVRRRITGLSGSRLDFLIFRMHFRDSDPPLGVRKEISGNYYRKKSWSVEEGNNRS